MVQRQSESVRNSGSPCLQLSHEDEVNFGEGGIGFANNKTIVVENGLITRVADGFVDAILQALTGGGAAVVEVRSALADAAE